MPLPAYVRHPVTTAMARWGRIPGLRTAKATLAAVLAYVAADLLNTTDAPILASLTALLVVQLTVYETVAQGIQRILSVLAGVLVAVAIAAFVGLSWWSLGAVVAVSLVLGQFLRLGPHILEVPISAMLVLAVGGAGAEGAAVGRVYETLIGAAVGVVVNFAIAPPRARAARGRRPSATWRTGWRSSCTGWPPRCAAAGHATRRNGGSPRRGRWGRSCPGPTNRWPGPSRAPCSTRAATRCRMAQPRLRTALTALEHCYILMRTMCREIFDRTFYLPPELAAEAYGPEARVALADVLDCAAEAMSGVAEVAAGTQPVEPARARVLEHLVELHRRRDRLGKLLLIDPNADAAAWQQHGALLAAVDRLRVELEAAVHPTSGPWTPPVIGEGPRQAMRRAIDAAAEDALPLLTERPRQAARRVIDVAAEAATNAAAAAEAAADELRAARHPAPDAAAQARGAAMEAAAAAGAAAVAQAAAEVAAEVAAEAEVDEPADGEPGGPPS